MDRIRDEAVQAVTRAYERRRRMLRPLAWSMLVLLVAILGLLTAVFASGGVAASEFSSMCALLVPLTLLAALFARYAHRRGEARLVEALSHQPPRVLGASVSYLSGHAQPGGRPLLEVRTLDRRLWFVEMPAPLVHDVAAWLSRAGAAAAQAGAGYRRGAPRHPRGLIPWSSIVAMPALCAHCAQPTDRRTVATVTQRDGAIRKLTVPVCPRCHRRQVARVVAAIAVTASAFAVGQSWASSQYPPGAMRGVIIVGCLAVSSLFVWLGWRLTPVLPLIAEREGGTAGAELLVRFGHPDFHDAVRLANAG